MQLLAITVSTAFPTVRLYVFVKGLYELFPACFAVIVTFPAPLIVNVLPLMTATDVLEDVQVSVRPSLVFGGRGYELSPVVMGYTEALEYMGESFDSKDYEIPSYEVVKQREIGEKDVDEPVKTEVHPTQSIFDIKAAAEAELANTKNEQTPVKENEYCR